MDELVDIFEDILACDLIEFSCKHSHLGVVLGVLPFTYLHCEYGLKIQVLLLQVSQILFDDGNFLNGCSVEVLLHGRLQVDQSTSAVFELKSPPVETLLS
jgi:hypothetical protein